MLELGPRRYRQATVAGLLAATAALGLGAERLVDGHLLPGGLLLAAGALVATGVLSIRLEGAQAPEPVLLFTRDECPHCDEARAILESLQPELGFDLWEVDVTGDDELEAAYGTEVPVVVHEGRRLASLEVREDEVREAFTRAGEPG
jgi:glutaredoxin